MRPPTARSTREPADLGALDRRDLLALAHLQRSVIERQARQLAFAKAVELVGRRRGRGGGVVTRTNVVALAVVLAVLIGAAPAQARPHHQPKAHAAACQYAGGRLVPVGARERNLTNCLSGSRLTADERACLIATTGSVAGAVIGLIIPPASAAALARAIISGAAGSCLTIVLRDGG
jgi:hypothetical protein